MHELKQGYAILSRENSPEKEIIKQEYQRQKLLAEINANRQKIQERLNQLSKECSSQLSPQQSLALRRHERTLNIITERNFQDIAKTLSPAQVKALKVQKEREEERNSSEVFSL